MDKSPDAFRTISEVAEDLQTPAHVLRFWESRFPQVRPVKRAGGRRYYRPSDVALLAGIRRLLHDEGMTIRGVQKVLREQGVRHVAGLSAEEGDTLDLTAQASPPEAPEAEQAPQTEAPAMAEPDLPPEDEADAPAVTPAAFPAPDPGAATEPPTEQPPPPVQKDASLPPAAAPTTLSDLPLFAGQDRPAPPPAEEAEPATLAARLRALPPGALAARQDRAAAVRAALADLHARLSDRARGPRR